jgi:hypothetical protein
MRTFFFFFISATEVNRKEQKEWRSKSVNYEEEKVEEQKQRGE